MRIPCDECTPHNHGVGPCPENCPYTVKECTVCNGAGFVDSNDKHRILAFRLEQALWGWYRGESNRLEFEQQVKSVMREFDDNL